MVERVSVILVCHWLPDGELPRWRDEFADCEFVDGRDPAVAARELPRANIVYGLPDVGKLAAAASVRWIQLASAGVPAALCPVALERNIRVTNLAGLYGPTIAEHAVGLMLILSRNLQIAERNQAEKKWDRSVANTMRDLHGAAIAIVGLGNIGQNIARLCKALGMRVVGCRRTPRPTPFTDRVYPLAEMNTMLAEADYVAVAAPLTRETDGLLGPAEFKAMRPGAIYINVSRGQVAQEAALVDALQSGHLGGAGLDVFAVEPLPAEHPLWSMPNVAISPHVSGETVNNSALPAQRFTRNLRSWLAGRELEGNVDVALGY
ncbi:MAG: D-2-hydroxyacid dehydrogenase [Gemmataceae bacterium]|nr:D-2-hydroxyacid dehydrogenase [Gemmataceae bacterium]